MIQKLSKANTDIIQLFAHFISIRIDSKISETTKAMTGHLYLSKFSREMCKSKCILGKFSSEKY